MATITVDVTKEYEPLLQGIKRISLEGLLERLKSFRRFGKDTNKVVIEEVNYEILTSEQKRKYDALATKSLNSFTNI